MLVFLAKVFGNFPGAILLPMSFVGWVIISERRTRNLAQLIRAARKRVGDSGASDTRRRSRR